MPEKREAQKEKSLAKLVVFNTETDKSPNKYNLQKIYRGLYGWKQTVHTGRGKKVYRYWRPGVLEEVPHIRPTTSTIVVSPQDYALIAGYLTSGGAQWWQKWTGKVDFRAFDVLISDDEIEEAVRNYVSKIEFEGKQIADYLDVFLGMDMEKGEMLDKLLPVVTYVEQLLSHEWIAKTKDSKVIREKLQRLKGVLGLK